MAKTGFWLRNAKGKLAGATIYQQNGETVMREIVTPSNPKTERQIIQRIVMHTVMQAYSKMKEICDHSFEGFKKGQDTMSYFMKRNVQITREAIARYQASGTAFMNMYNFLPLGVKGFAPNQFQVSMGSLPRVPVNFTEAGLCVVPVIKENTYQAVIDALGVQRGDQLTFITLNGNLTGNNVAGVSFNFCRVILDPTAADYSQLPLSTAFLDENGKINAPSVRNEGNFDFAISANGLSFMSMSNAIACTVIVSRKVNENWLRSTAYLAYDGSEVISLGEAIAQADGSNETIYAPSDQYLNNAGQGGGQAAEGSGDSGQTTASPRLTGASIGGNTMIAGTKYTLNTAVSPSTDPLVVQGTDVNGLKLSVRDGDQEVAQGTFANGTCTISNGSWADGKTYTLVIVDDDIDIATNYSFQPAWSPSNDD